MDISLNLVKDFRSYLNSNKTILLKIYGNVEGTKNHWKVIHSCLDWISVAVNYIKQNWNISGDHDEKSMHLFSLISSADLIYESIIQLNRVLQESEWPLVGERTIFSKGKYYDLDDNKYFKEIRSFFGAHPVNLKRDPGNGSKNKDSFYASWSFERDEGQFCVILYSLSNNLEDIHVTLNISELKEFIKTRYNYLNNFIRVIDKKIETYNKKYIQTKIELDEGIKKLQSLKREAIERFNNEYINDIVDKLIMVSSVTTGIPNLQDEESYYKTELNNLIKEIHHNLQNMQLQDFKYGYLLHNTFPSEISYSVGKILCSIQSNHTDPMFDYHISELNKFSSNKYQIDVSEDKAVIFLKLCLLLYSNNHKKKPQV